MGKIFVLSVTDHEEYILSRIMEIIAAEPGFDHIVSSHPCNTLVFPGLELRLKERTVHRNGELISMTHREFATLVYLANHPSWVFSAGQIYEEKRLIFQTTWGIVILVSLLFFGFTLLFFQPLSVVMDYAGTPSYLLLMGSIITVDAVTALPFAKLREENKASAYVKIRVVTILVNLFFLYRFLFCDTWD
mgnify:CR=1 FL=1